MTIFPSLASFIMANFLMQVLSTQACLSLLFPPKQIMSRQYLQEPQLTDKHPAQVPHLQIVIIKNKTIFIGQKNNIT